MVLAQEKYKQIIAIFIVLQPFIDFLTALETTSGKNITIGLLLRPLFMLILFFVMFRFLYYQHRQHLVWFLLSYTAIPLMLIVSDTYKTNTHIWQDLSFAFKTGYYLTMIHVSILLLKHKLVTRQSLHRALIIVFWVMGLSYWTAIATGTSIPSYAYEKLGYSGWTFSANELSASVVLWLALCLAWWWHDQRFPMSIALLLITSMTPMIGTKTAFWGGVILLVCTALSLVFTAHETGWFNRRTIGFTAIVIVFLCLIPISPFFKNITSKQVIDAEPATQSSIQSPESKATTALLSSRDDYLEQTRQQFLEANTFQKLFGLGYAGNTSTRKMIEMDFFDLGFDYGWVGSLLLLSPLIYSMGLTFKQLFPLTFPRTILFISLGLCLGMAGIAGHILFAPSVMTYIAICIACIRIRTREEVCR